MTYTDEDVKKARDFEFETDFSPCTEDTAQLIADTRAAAIAEFATRILDGLEKADFKDDYKHALQYLEEVLGDYYREELSK